MIFCQIDKPLVDIIKKYAGDRIVVDVGCGDGLLGFVMRQVISIDLVTRSSALIPDIIEMDAADFPFKEHYFPVFVRPCHGHFVPRIMHAHKNNVRNFMYVSMPHNLEVDIDLDEFNAEQVEDWVGQDGERVYLITVKEAHKDG